MRPFTRQSTRLANSTVRKSSGSRSFDKRQQQAFHVGPKRSQDPRSTGEGPDSRTSHHEQHDYNQKHGNEASRQEQTSAPENKESKTVGDDQKPATRRARQKRMNEVPKPPPIPDWFLKNNLILYKDSPGPEGSGSSQVIRCVDTETGHTLFSVPYSEDWPTRTKIERHDAGEEKISQPNSVRTEKGNEETPTVPITGVHPSDSNTKEPSVVRSKEDHQRQANGSELDDFESRVLAVTQAGKKHPTNHTDSAIDGDFFNHKFSEASQRPSGILPAGVKAHIRDVSVGDSASASKFASRDDPSLLESRSNPMRWAFLELETSIRAAMSLAKSNQQSSGFAVDRVDLALNCPDPNSHDQMDDLVRDLANATQSDLIRLDANDFAELTEGFVGHGRDGPGSFSSVGYDALRDYSTTSLEADPAESRQPGDEEANEAEEDEVEEDEQNDARSNNSGPFRSMFDLRRMLQDGRNSIGQALNARVIGIAIPETQQPLTAYQRSSRSRATSSTSETNRDDARLAALLDDLLDAPRQKLTSGQKFEKVDVRKWLRKKRPFDLEEQWNKTHQRILRHWRSDPAIRLSQTARIIVKYLEGVIHHTQSGGPPITLAHGSEASSAISDQAEQKRTIVHVRDLRDLCHSQVGDMIIHRLVKLIRRRRRIGEQIILIGTSTSEDISVLRTAGPHDFSTFQNKIIPPFFRLSLDDDTEFETQSSKVPEPSLNEAAHGRTLETNLRHAQSMIRRLRPDADLELLSSSAGGQLSMPGMHVLGEKVLSMSQVQRIVMIAVGLSETHASSATVQPVHVALAGFIVSRVDHAENLWAAFKERKQAKLKAAENVASGKAGSDGKSIQNRMERLKKSCNQHESKLLSGMVDPQNIKTGFADVHAPAETIEALKTLTSLSLLRPEAFKYGVLANDRLPGLLLYGPPGTGKTLLAKAVAKESRATVLEVSGAQIYEKYVGEGEKMVRAVWTLAKKLSPCVVFIDEADAILGSRSSAGNRNSHREIINQFLREWDGMDDHSVFMMVATNRPFDIDEAVLRRLPRRLLIDLPVAKDRESILRIHLKSESLDSSISLNQLAEQTPLYSGSDLKNLSVAAALACVREENELAASHKDDKDFKLPEKRTLTSGHFEKALTEISASISEDMSTLTAIRKFDKEYGDRKGRRKKVSYGFGASDGLVDESAARVRQPSASSPSP